MAHSDDRGKADPVPERHPVIADRRSMGHLTEITYSGGTWYVNCRGCLWWALKGRRIEAVEAGEGHERQGVIVWNA